MKDKYKPYVRKHNKNDFASSFRQSFRLEFYKAKNKPFYVMVQRGFKNKVIAVGANKRDVKQSIAHVAFEVKKFNEWANDFKKLAKNGE